MPLKEVDFLPELPKRERTKKEQEITPKILQWFRDNYQGSCAIEIKQTKTNTLAKSKVEPHQIKALLSASGAGIVHKIADNKRKNPFDAFMLQGVKSYIVVAFISHKFALAYNPETWDGASFLDSSYELRIPF